MIVMMVSIFRFVDVFSMFLALAIVVARGPPAVKGELAAGKRDARA